MTLKEDIQHRSLFSMHSAIDMVFPGMAEAVADEIVTRVSHESSLLESILDAYNPSSETWKVNASAPGQWTPVSDRLWNILEECRRYHLLTRGFFDISLGRGGVETDNRLQRIMFGKENVALDFGAIGKGLLLRETDRILTAMDVQNCFISFGGSSVLTRGHHPHGDHWPLTGRNREDGLPSFPMRNDCASFSTGIPEGKTTGHIVHPYTQQLAGSNRMAGIQCKNPVTAEVLSTVFIIADPVEAKELADGFCVKRAFIAEKMPGRKPIIIFHYD